MKFTLINGDCETGLPGLNPGDADVCLFDAPHFGDRIPSANEAYSDWLAGIVADCQRIVGKDNVTFRTRQVCSDRVAELVGLKTVPLAQPELFANKSNEKDMVFISSKPFVVKDQLVTYVLPLTGHKNAFDLGFSLGLVEAKSEPGQTILDPFCGSCAIGCAAVILGREFVGIDCNERWLKEGKQRLEKAVEFVRSEESECN